MRRLTDQQLNTRVGAGGQKGDNGAYGCWSRSNQAKPQGDEGTQIHTHSLTHSLTHIHTNRGRGDTHTHSHPHPLTHFTPKARFGEEQQNNKNKRRKGRRRLSLSLLGLTNNNNNNKGECVWKTLMHKPSLSVLTGKSKGQRVILDSAGCNLCCFCFRDASACHVLESPRTPPPQQKGMEKEEEEPNLLFRFVPFFAVSSPEESMQDCWRVACLVCGRTSKQGETASHVGQKAA